MARSTVCTTRWINRRAAINQLNAFIHEVRALEQSGQLDQSVGDVLIAEAQTIIVGIGRL